MAESDKFILFWVYGGRVLVPGGVLAWAQGCKFCQHFHGWFGNHRLWTLTRFRKKGEAASGHVWIVQTKEKTPIPFPNTDSLVIYETLGPLKKLHPCIKTTEEMCWMVENLTKPGQIVLDCFCGLGAFVALAFLVVASAVAVASDPSPNFKITTKRKDDVVEVRAEKARTVFSVKSPFGISQAVIERQGEKWPKVVVLRLHLKGLENFRASNGKVTLAAAVSVQDSKPKVRLWKDGREDALLDVKSPFWMDLRILTGDGKRARKIPLKDGYFEIELPRVLFEGNPKSITLIWIDFYR